MKTSNLDKAYTSVAQLLQKNLKKEIKEKAYRTGDLYRSVTVKTVPISTGESIQASMNSYYEYTNDGTRYIEGQYYVQEALRDTDKDIEEVIAEATVNDILIEMDKIAN